eukprot:scaffold1159_cov160-Ochromonas_danica.AAC.4
MMESDLNNHLFHQNNDLECRICRGNGEEGRPLYHPCRCTGSIGLVHQDCLEAWLDHSKKDHCELCSMKYTFEPYYDENTPAVLPLSLLFKSLIVGFFCRVLPFLVRAVLAIVIWILLVPIGTVSFYRTFMRHTVNSTTSFSWQWQSLFSVQTIAYGLVLDALIALSLLIFMSFTDFVRFHWVQPVEGLAAEGAVNNDLPAAVPVAQPPAPPVQNPFDDRDPVEQREVAAMNPEVFGLRHRRNRLLNQPDDEDDDEDEGDRESNWGIDTDDFSDFSENDIVDHLMEEEKQEEDENADQLPPGPPMVNLADIPLEDIPVLDEDLNGNNLNGNGNGGNINLEVRMALLELLGLQGPLYVIARNAVWLLVFISAYLAVVGCIPRMMGKRVAVLVWSRMSSLYTYFSGLSHVLQVAPDTTSRIPIGEWFAWVVGKVEGRLGIIFAVAQQAVEISENEDLPLQWVDFFYVALGYLFLFLMIFSLAMGSHYLPYFLDRHLQTLIFHIQQLAVMVKVSLLLMVRIFILPLAQGVMMLAVFSTCVLHPQPAQWATFLARNSVGVFGLAWVAGITFMLSMTISILQLREVLHPDFLAKIIRPQEAHAELIQSLISESGYVHAKRIAVSFGVYTALMAILVFLPCTLYYLLSVQYPLLPVAHLQLWYSLPTIQLPVELLIGHLTFLSVLDKYKDLIGRAQYYTLSLFARWVGLEKFFLPHVFSMKRARRRRVAANVDLPLSSEHEQEGEQAIQGEEALHRQVVRPPAGWDTQSAVQCSRWAWHDEERSHLELSLAPRSVSGNGFYPRLIMFCFLSYITALCSLGGMVGIPLAIGRLLTRSIYLPSVLYHDPLHFLIGGKLCLMILDYCRAAKIWTWKLHSRWQLICQDRDTILRVVRILGMRWATYISVGCLLCLGHDLFLFFIGRTNEIDPLAGKIYDNLPRLLNFVLPTLPYSPLVPALSAESVSVIEELWMMARIAIKGMILVEGSLFLALSGRIGMRLLQYRPETMLALLALFTAPPLLRPRHRQHNHVHLNDPQARASLQEEEENEAIEEKRRLELQLAAVEDLVVAPAFNSWVIENALWFLGLYLFVFPGLETMRSQPTVFLMNAVRGIMLVVFLLWKTFLGELILRTVSTCLEDFYLQVRNDNYLIGKKLVNARPLNESATAGGATSRQ